MTSNTEIHGLHTNSIDSPADHAVDKSEIWRVIAAACAILGMLYIWSVANSVHF